MSVSDVEGAILRIREAKFEWDEVNLGYWREVDTRYTFVDPMLQALGWDTADPKQCHPEYFRGRVKVDYALFVHPDRERIGRYEIAPDLVIECKALGTSLEKYVTQLRGYTSASPRMPGGKGVLTDGGKWRVYDPSLRGAFPSKFVDEVDVLGHNPSAAAQFLDRWLGRPVSR